MCSLFLCLSVHRHIPSKFIFFWCYVCLNFFSTDGIPKRLDNPEVLRCLSSICLEATDGRLKVFVGLNANISCLEGLGCWSSTTRKDAGCDDANDDLCDFCNHCWRLWCCCLTCLHSRCRNLLSIWNREDVFTPCSGLCGNFHLRFSLL